MRKAFTFVLAVAMVMAMAVPAFAAASPTAPAAATDKTTSLPVVVESEKDSLVVSVEEADTLSDEAKETFAAAQKELADIAPEGMTTKYFFYYVPASAEAEGLTLNLGDTDVKTVVVKQLQDGKWVELKVVVNADGTITLEGLKEGPVAVFTK